MVMPKVRLALAQTNPTVGAIQANLEQALDQISKAKDQGADLVVFGEMAITG